ncbi:hypothetical protein IMSHALPRED_004355, partial [Imshaugia aleurites]
MARVSFAESSRVNGTTTFSPPAQHIRRKHSFSNQLNSAELASAQKANKQALAQEQRKKDKTSVKVKATADRLAKTMINATTQRGKKKNIGANKNDKKIIQKSTLATAKKIHKKQEKEFTRSEPISFDHEKEEEDLETDKKSLFTYGVNV